VRLVFETVARSLPGIPLQQLRSGKITDSLWGSNTKSGFFTIHRAARIDGAHPVRHPFGAACGRPKSLRDLVERRLSSTMSPSHLPKNPLYAGFLVDGWGTRIRTWVGGVRVGIRANFDSNTSMRSLAIQSLTVS
jgi:hypothetical protein